MAKDKRMQCRSPSTETGVSTPRTRPSAKQQHSQKAPPKKKSSKRKSLSVPIKSQIEKHLQTAEKHHKDLWQTTQKMQLFRLDQPL